MSDQGVRRGAPTEDGWYDLLFPCGRIRVRRLDGGKWFHQTGKEVNSFNTDLRTADIIAHRPHTPLVVPELKELHRCEGRPCVVRYGFDREPRFATRYDYGAKHHLLQVERKDTEYPCAVLEENNEVEFLTRAEVESLGYKWPEGCEEPK